MGGICSVAEGVLAAGFIAEGISQAVLREKIKKLIKGHEDEFKTMNTLYSFVDKILNQKNLISQLNASVLFATDNWNSIFEDLEDKNNLLVKVLQNFPTVKASDFKFTSASGLMFGVTVLAFAYISYDFIAGEAKVQLKSDVANFKQFCKKTSARIRSKTPEIQASKADPNGQVEVQSFKSVTEIPQTARQSSVQKVQKDEKAGKTSKVVLGLRVIFIAISIYYFVDTAINLSKLNNELKKYQKYFKSKGDFQTAEEGIIDLMNFVAVDIFNLANCSRAAIYDSKNMFLVKSITVPSYSDKLLGYAELLNADSYGVTDDFIDQSKTLLNSCNTVTTSGKSIDNKLKDLKTSFQTFFDSKKPETVFLNVSIELSSVVGKYSIIAESINDDQHNVNRFLTKVSESIQDRGSDFDQYTAQKKQSVDSGILDDTLENYKKIFDFDKLTLENMDTATKNVIFQSIVSFTSSFYADDLTGESLFGLNIAQTKSSISYKEILDSVNSQANLIPVSKQDATAEQKEVDSWLETANKLNAQSNYAYWKSTDVPKSVYRYIRLQVDSYISKTTGETLGALVGYEGMNLKVNSEYFNVERNSLKNTYTLAAA